MFNKDIEILYLAEICKYMNTPHFRTELGPTLDRVLLTKETWQTIDKEILGVQTCIPIQVVAKIGPLFTHE